MALNEREFNFFEADLVKKTEICKNCINIVVGKGNKESNILFVGEAPGSNEDLQGVPFVGAAGKNLDKLLKSAGLRLNEVYIANILKCKPPKNRNPTLEEIKMHTPWLIRQIKEMNPIIVCSLGNYSTKFFLANGDVDKINKQPGITSLHGKIREIEFFGLKIKLIPLFHPAAIIYNQKLKPLWEKDIKIVKKEIRV
jgi:uracil-DNA glycosylase